MDASKTSGKRPEESLKHRKVKQALVTFRDLVGQLMHQYKADQHGNLEPKKKALVEAAVTMRREHQWENTEKRVGHLLGIEVGDSFEYMAELNVIGLHQQFWNGIDYVGTGRNSLATSIVVTNRYDNVRESSDTLVYSGHGGNPTISGNVSLRDQKMEGGNLALKNSMEARSPVRVILKVFKKFNASSNSNFSFVYDGLYIAEKMTQQRGRFGNLVFKFTLHRISEQPQTCVALNDGVTSRQLGSFVPRKRQKSKGRVLQKDVVRVNDLSNGKEKFVVRVVTSSDCVEMPTSFEYIVDNIYSRKFKQAVPCGCDCADECGNNEKCVCSIKNGGTMSYDHNKRLASPMESTHVYECGPSCKCSSSCINRVSQHGIQFQLEVFMTALKGWGVRTRSFIPSGSFVCEYVGEIHDKKEAGRRLQSDYIFPLGAGNGIINATKFGNIGRFINHSCSPNLVVKDVMYDQNNKNLPHKMLFAIKNIPAGRELSFDYNSKEKFKIKSNPCYCGSPECNGQIYI